jgi:hypothetical protein
MHCWRHRLCGLEFGQDFTAQHSRCAADALVLVESRHGPGSLGVDAQVVLVHVDAEEAIWCNDGAGMRK